MFLFDIFMSSLKNFLLNNFEHNVHNIMLLNIHLDNLHKFFLSLHYKEFYNYHNLYLTILLLLIFHLL
ncbi:hypothetical protein GLOIN_2v1698827 [Rhizophagus irregularis DAOM 181602=DAOM 197198]|uniref:Uncharacterized protein n=1 Tax=Rhizophagus irregularis (strain DAOM 181602 / DAOM 197198 / MUCL 43194) TaxID=747089 RepID=A0A2P4P9L5_RHIID|nr:hypothetical protein GLOIN_2v1698827 [Rhizophagus irregularis DAOM 181602=DAOM 197198]POG62092.1 hypothetical protein GLOIN_2v1698827 [Rhizophagus irregularis DAOM 181602=DAOM 197198]|eukprot:XP_025168958.1 hypothetical protein GLOIN_2v1698827 [Rhizophagus irregularis DAOM 181602=DAOM 197198]